MKENPVIYKSRMQVTFKSVVCYYLSITQMVSIRNHHMHKTQMHAQIRAHLVERVTALFMLPAFTLCAGVSLALPASVQLKYIIAVLYLIQEKMK